MKFFRNIAAVLFIAGMIATGCSSGISLHGKLCLQDALCENKDKVFVHTVINILETGRVILGYDGLPCAELNIGKDADKFSVGDILTLSVKKFDEGQPICPVKVSKYESNADYPTEEITITSDQVKLE